MVSFGARDQVHTVQGLDIRIVGGSWQCPNDPLSPRIVAELRAADIIHCHQREIRLSKLVALAGRALGKRVVVTDHGGGAWSWWASRIPAEHLFDAHLHVSEFSRRISGHEHLRRAVVIGCGVDTERFSPGHVDPHPSQPPVLYVGRLLPHKGIDVLLESLPPAIPLQIVGSPLDDRYLSRLQRLAVGKPVTFHHDWTDEQLVDAYRACLCVVLPSVHRDCYGNETAVPELVGQTLLEGMACAKPVICTDAGAMPEVVENGVGGVVVPQNSPHSLANAITTLANRPGVCRSMGAAGRRHVLQNFTWPIVVERCQRSYAT
jgi:glycosyltransferase involved in cell wall biosynthesis